MSSSIPSSFRQLAAGAQTLRLFTALVCSIGVTSAVAGPMAWQALEYRRDEAAAVAPAVPDGSPAMTTQRVEPGPGAPALGSGSNPTSSAPTSSLATSATGAPPAAKAGVLSGAISANRIGSAEPATVPGSGATSTTSSSTSTSTGSSPQVGTLPAPPVSPTAVVPPTTSSPIPATTTVPVTSTVPATVTTTDPLAEFNPEPPCDDTAHELRVGAAVNCPPATR